MGERTPTRPHAHTSLTTKTGAWGVPSKASAEQGRERLEAAFQRQADYVQWALKRITELKGARSVVDREGTEG